MSFFLLLLLKYSCPGQAPEILTELIWDGARYQFFFFKCGKIYIKVPAVDQILSWRYLSAQDQHSHFLLTGGAE